jgi:hypothetical protein
MAQATLGDHVPVHYADRLPHDLCAASVREGSIRLHL